MDFWHTSPSASPISSYTFTRWSIGQIYATNQCSNHTSSSRTSDLSKCILSLSSIIGSYVYLISFRPLYLYLVSLIHVPTHNICNYPLYSHNLCNMLFPHKLFLKLEFAELVVLYRRSATASQVHEILLSPRQRLSIRVHIRTDSSRGSASNIEHYIDSVGVSL